MRRPWRSTFWVAVVVVALLVVLRPLAHASPADPSWIAGLYDGADFDDVVHFLVTCSGVAAAGFTIPRPVPRIPGPVVEGGAGSTAAAPRSSALTRAPPLPFAPPV